MGMQRKLFQNELTKTEAAQKAREKRKKGSKKVIQKGRIIYVGDARKMVRAKKAKAKKKAKRKEELARERARKKALKDAAVVERRSNA
jgi:hypothetical protein